MRRYFSALLRRNPIVLVLIVLVIVFSVLSENFLRPENLTNILRQGSMLGFVALGMSFVLLARGIDLSVGAIVALGSVLMAGISATMPAIVGVYAALIAGLAVGLVNGFIVTRMRFQPIIATLSTMATVRGLAMIYSDSRPIFGTMPDVYFLLSSGTIFGIPVPFVLFICTCVVSATFLNLTRTGRQIYQVGGNEEAARLAGVNIVRIRMLTYALSGVLCAVAGLILAARTQSGEAVRSGVGWELDAIAAAAIGGMSLFGGIGTVVGTVCGTFIIAVMANGFNLLGINPYWQRIVLGIVLALAVATYSRTQLRALFVLQMRRLRLNWSRNGAGSEPKSGKIGGV